MEPSTPPEAIMAPPPELLPPSLILPKGVYVPMPAFFTATTSSAVNNPVTNETIDPDPGAAAIDLAAMQRHTARLLSAGVAGLVVHGSNGEAVHLTRRERRAAIEAVADVVRHEADALHAPVPVVAGCSAQSVRETVELCREAREAGATHALVLPPGYYKGLFGGGAPISPSGSDVETEKEEGGAESGSGRWSTRSVVEEFYWQVANKSPLPILIYNFPAAANGVDLDSDTILRLAAHPRIVGVKLTCGNTGKLARLVAGAPLVRGGRNDFFIGGGSADFILQGLVVGAHGTISGFANLAPRACVRIVELFEQGQLEEARELQHEVARGDWLAIRYGFLGVKAAMPIFHGPGEASCTVPRLPFRALGGSAVEEIAQGMAGALEIEKRLAIQAGEKSASQCP